jgi:hypothetical protein
MKNFTGKYQSRNTESYLKIKNAYEFGEVKEPPVLVQDVNYWLSGEVESWIPDNYFDLPASMVDYQVEKIKRHMETFGDCYIPFLMPWYGTGVVPSALGCKVAYQPKMDPTIEGHVISRPEDIRNLKKPDPYKDGQMPRVLKTIDYMKAETDLPVGVTDAQGPLNIALSLCGVEKLFFWMYDYPDLVHEIMEFATEVFIDWIKVQKKHAGQASDSGAFPHGIILPEGFGGIWLADDDCTIISPALYQEFVVPYNSKIFKAFGGGTLHFCGTAEHQIDNFLKTEGLTGINSFCMGNIKQLVMMQEKFKNKIALMACDFAPLDVEKYYHDLIEALSFRGLIVASFPAPAFALIGGKYESLKRDPGELSGRIFDVIGNEVKRKR